jgi:protein-L-isoaspartate(D-aspartate) O-methyltransferase
MPDLARARQRMADVQLARRGIRDTRVLDAMRSTPREAFVEEGFEEFAYEDGPLPIAEGQTISQPYIVALMLEAADLKPGDKILEVGTGSGYAAAVASRIAREVHTIERHASLAAMARRRSDRLCGNLTMSPGFQQLSSPSPAQPFQNAFWPVFQTGSHGRPRPQACYAIRLPLPLRRTSLP